MRTAIIYAGWPVLLLGSILFVVEAYRFYKRTNRLALGKLILAQTFSILVGMYSLGIVSTIYMYCNLDTGVKVVMPIFLVWFATMAILYYISRRWRNEAANINILYYRIKERSEKLKQEKTKLSKIAEHMTTGAVLLDTGGKPMFINREAKAIAAPKTNDESKLLKLLYKKFSKYKLEDRVKRCIKGEPSNIIDVKIGDKIYEIFLRCLIDQNKQAKAYFGHFIWIRDVTEEKMLVQAERRFLTVASHKLRTPLTGIKGFIDMTLSEAPESLNSTQREYLNEAQQCTSIMSEVVDQLLYSTEADIKKIKIMLKQTALDKLVQKAIAANEILIGKKKCNVTFTKQKGVDFRIPTDERLLGKAISILIENAVMYSGNEKAKVEVGLTNDQKGGILLSIKDSGIGIPRAEQSKIFSKFYRAENALKVHTEGIGLNLNIARLIVESLGGTISFESKENKGSIFTVTLPVKAKKQKLRIR